MSHKYILVGHEAVPREDLIEWARWYETAQRRVRNTKIAYPGGEARVSTVFLGLDHNLGGIEPHLFETMIFDLPGDHPLSEYQERCSTWEEAEMMHYKAICAVLKSLRAGGQEDRPGSAAGLDF